MKHFNIICIVLTFVLLTFTCFACTVPEANEDTNNSIYKNWMSYIDDTALIKQIAIPGSHDSGTIDMSTMECTQNTTIKQQMESGVRYFDIRVAENDNILKIFHMTTGVEFIPILIDIVDFLKTNPTEFLVLDFQHFKNNAPQKVIDAIKEYKLNELALVNNTDKSDLDWVDSLTLAECRGKALILFGIEDANGATADFIYDRNNDKCTLPGCVLDSYYFGDLNRKKSADYISEGLPFYYSKYKEKNKGIWVLQGQLTKPMANLYNLEEDHNPDMTQYIKDIANDADRLSITNIIMRDFIGNDLNKVNTIIELNRAKGIATNLPTLS